MTRVIWKFPLYPATPVQLFLPRGAEILHVGAQDEVPTMWVLLDPAALHDPREFFVYGTGHPIDEEGLVHLGTVQTNAGFVWHVFERAGENR